MECSSLCLIRRCLMWFWMRISWKMHVNTWRSTWRFTGVLHIYPVLPLLTLYWTKVWSLHPQPTLANRLYKNNDCMSSSVIWLSSFCPLAVFWNSRADRMTAVADVGQQLFDLFVLFSSGFWCFYLVISYLRPCRSILCCHLGSDWEVTGHRDDGTTRGQQQPSSLRSTSIHAWRKAENKRNRRNRRPGMNKWYKISEEEQKEVDLTRWSSCITAAPLARAPCSHHHTTTQGRYLPLHAFLVTKTSTAVQRLHITHTRPSSYFLLHLYLVVKRSDQRSHCTEEPDDTGQSL